MNSPLHGDADNHPSLALPKLSDTLNAAIHLELKWEKEVRSELAAAQAEQLAAAEGSSSGSSSSGTEGMIRVAALDKSDSAWARIMASNLGQLSSLAQWSSLKHKRLIPAVTRVTEAALAHGSSREWALAYRMLMSDLTGERERERERAPFCSICSLQRSTIAH